MATDSYDCGEPDARADDKTIGRTVHLLRGPTVTQQALAEEMKLLGHAKWSQATVWSVESGARPLRLTEAVDLAALLGVRLEDLVRGKDEALLTTALSELRVATMRWWEAKVWANEWEQRVKEGREAVVRLRGEAGTSTQGESL